MNLFERVKKYHLPTGQFRVIERILNDLETFSFLSGNELCNEFDISYSSLTRMAKALKYSGFPELKKEIENLYKSESSPTSQAELFINSVKAKSILDIVMHDEINNLSKLKTSINESEIIETAKQINKSKRVFIVGIGKMEFIVDKFASGLALLGLETYKLTELGFSKQLEAHSLNKDDVVIAFSINKELEELENTLVQLKEKNIKCFLISDKKTGHLQKHATVSFIVPSRGQGAINSFTSYLALTNILEAYLFSLDKYVHLSKIKKIEQRWSSLPIFIK